MKIFRKRIPKVGGFDISAIPAIFILDILGQATAALGAEFPKEMKPFGKIPEYFLRRSKFVLYLPLINYNFFLSSLDA